MAECVDVSMCEPESLLSQVLCTNADSCQSSKLGEVGHSFIEETVVEGDTDSGRIAGGGEALVAEAQS